MRIINKDGMNLVKQTLERLKNSAKEVYGPEEIFGVELAIKAIKCLEEDLKEEGD